MAKAVAHLTCQYCGKEFTKTKTCRNRREADSWTEWMEGVESCCGSCWYKKKMEEEKEAGLQAKVRLGSIYNPEAELWFVLFGDTYAVKDDLKKIGARWSDVYPSEESEAAGGIFGDLLSGPPLKRWAICCKMEDEATIQKKADELNALGFNIVFPDETSMSTWLTLRKQLEDRRKEEERLEEEKRKEKEREMEAEIAKIGPIPTWPESFPPAEGRWNGTIYGKKGNRSVYIDGTKYQIEDDLAKQVEQIAKERDAWRAKKNEIQEKYRLL